MISGISFYWKTVQANEREYIGKVCYFSHFPESISDFLKPKVEYCGLRELRSEQSIKWKDT